MVTQDIIVFTQGAERATAKERLQRKEREQAAHKKLAQDMRSANLVKMICELPAV